MKKKSPGYSKKNPKNSLVKEIPEPYISQIIIECMSLFFYSKDYSLVKLVDCSRIVAQPLNNERYEFVFQTYPVMIRNLDLLL